MEKKLQVFISSTYKDLIEDREVAVKAILDAGHIPAGMELFKSGKSQMDTIYKWIDDSDAYMLILGGRYGSIEPKSGKSYTHLEYEYALGKSKPFFAVVLGDEELESRIKIKGGEIIETFEGNKYCEFKELVKSKICGFYNNMDGIRAEVHRQLNSIEKEYDLVGWIKADEIISKDKEEQYNQSRMFLEEENRKLKMELELLRMEKLNPLPMNENLKKLKDFFDSKGVTDISYSQQEWSVFTTGNSSSYGAPIEWGENPAIFISKNGVKDGICVELGLKYSYCPRLNKGAKIITENRMFRVDKVYE